MAPRYPGRAALLALGLTLLAWVLGTARVPCAFAWLFGVPCPACGSGRAVRAFLQGDPSTALHFNPLGIPAAFLLLVAGVGAVYLTWQRGTPRDLGTGRLGRIVARAAAATAGLEVLLWLLRFAGMLGAPVPV